MASLMKRGETYYARHVYYENGKRKEHKRSLETKDKAVAARRLNAVRAEIQSGKWGEPSKMRFAELARRFMLERRPVLKPATLDRYAFNLRKLLPVFGDVHVGELTRSSVSNFVATRRRDPGRNGRGQVSDASIRGDLACLSAVMAYGIEKEIIENNPVATYLKGAGKRVKRGAPRERYLTHEEEQRLLMAIRNGPSDGQQYRQLLEDAVTFAIDTGLRLREQFGLLLHDVTLGAKPHLVARETKAGKPRRVYLNERAQDVVSRRIGGTYLFERGGKKIFDMDRGFKAACDRAGIEDVQWHDLRRTAGCRLLQDKGARMEDVRDFLGHASVVTTEKHYAFLRKEDLHDLVMRPSIARGISGDIVPMRRIGGGR